MQKAIEYESGSKAILLLARVNFFLSVLRIRIYYQPFMRIRIQDSKNVHMYPVPDPSG